MKVKCAYQGANKSWEGDHDSPSPFLSGPIQRREELFGVKNNKLKYVVENGKPNTHACKDDAFQGCDDEHEDDKGHENFYDHEANPKHKTKKGFGGALAIDISREALGFYVARHSPCHGVFIRSLDAHFPCHPPKSVIKKGVKPTNRAHVLDHWADVLSICEA